ncbi:MAG: phage holin family protein [Acidaminococcaceae bacterium]
MSEMEKAFGMLRRGIENMLEFWPIKLMISALTSLFTWLLGGTEIIFAAVLVFVILDTLTKWASITKKYLIDHGADPGRINIFSIFIGWFCAWKKGYLETKELRKKWGDKLFAYLILIIAACQVLKLPEIILFGLPINKSITGGIYSFIAITELLSICENLGEAGNTKLANLRKFLDNLTNRITGGGYSVTMSATNITGNNMAGNPQYKEPAGDPGNERR